ncbi:MAG: PorT family protein [Candidatus Zixiibacteriota bacterium]|nr:MAG: PorT family protein [candidate division Zixibacteria bacterium]
MKRIVVITAMAGLALVAGFSTSQAGGKFELGPKIGMNYMTFGGDDADNRLSYFLLFYKGPDYVTGVTVGGFGRLHLNKYIALQLELIYVQKGSEWTYESYLMDSLITLTQWIRLDYIEVPVLVSFQIPTGSALSPFFFGGGSVGLKTSSKHAWRNVGGGIVVNNDGVSEILNASKTQLNFIFGGGFGFDLGANRLELIANYSMGLSNAFKDVEDVDAGEEVGIFIANESGEAAKLKTRQISVLAQLAFSL